jgi:hypothetical protein
MRAYEFILREAKYDGMIQSMLQKNAQLRNAQPNFPDYSEEIKWAKPHLKREDRVVWYLNLLKQYTADQQKSQNKTAWNRFQTDLFHYIGQQNIAKIQNYIFGKQSADEVLNQFEQFENEYKEKQEKYLPVRIQEGDKKIIEFPNGTAWWLLNRAYCPDEGRSGGHCGNVAGQNDRSQRILSYRTPDSKVILTFILHETGFLGEMKGANNSKPKSIYHDAILELLLNPIIKGITRGEYAPELDFSIFDLDSNKFSILAENKPELIGTAIAENPIQFLMHFPSDQILKNYEDFIDLSSLTSEDIIYAYDVIELDRWERILSILPHLLPEIKNIIGEEKFSEIESYELYLNFVKSNPISDRNYRRIPHLEYVPDRFKNLELCLTAIMHDPVELSSVSDDIQKQIYSKNPNIIKKCLSDADESWLITSLDEDLQNQMYLDDPKFTIRLALQTKEAFDKLSELLQTEAYKIDPERVRKAVLEGAKLYDISYSIRTPEICLAAVEHDPKQIQDVPPRILKSNPEIVRAALKKDRRVIRIIPDEILKIMNLPNY